MNANYNNFNDSPNTHFNSLSNLTTTNEFSHTNTNIFTTITATNTIIEHKPQQILYGLDNFFDEKSVDNYHLKTAEGINTDSLRKRRSNDFINDDDIDDDDNYNGHGTTYDIFGNAICRMREITPFNGDILYNESDNKNSIKRRNYHKNNQLSDSDNDNDDDSEWNVEKENHVPPFGYLITPLKTKKNNIIGFGNTGSLGSRTYSNRSPLEDITPPIGKHKNERYSSKIERTLRYSATPKTNNENGINNNFSSIKHFR